MYWDIYSKVYNHLNKLRPYQELKQHVLKVVFSLNGSGSCVDLGCGTGNLLNDRSNWTGVDSSEEMVSIARSNNPRSNFVVADLNKKLPFDDCAFNCVVTMNVCAYLDDPKKFISEAYRITAQNGYFVIATLRKSFNPTVIMLDHLKKDGPLTFLKNIFFAALIFVLNIPIIWKLRTGKYKGFEMEDLAELGEAVGFQCIQKELAYASQDVLLAFKK